MSIQKFENVRNIRINGKSIHVATFIIIQKRATLGYMMVNCFVKGGIKKAKQFLINVKMSETANLIK